MPTARFAVLAGRLAPDTLRSLAIIVVLAAVGYAVGCRFENGFAPAVGAVLLSALTGLAICCIGATIGLSMKEAEAVQSIGLIWLFPLTFASGAFMPVQSMPGWLQPVAEANPVTLVVESLRAMSHGGPLEVHLLESFAWTAGLFLVIVPLAVRSYKRSG